ncbi:MAG: zinc-ribbon domain-containing protein [Clostridia bacterium]|nr:zinc-ribbon domain-containing protein [Clostridia bacterium]
MFCNKCGKQLSDDAAFCSECGNQVGPAPAAAPKAAPAAKASVPPIFSRLISQIVNIFTKKDPVGVVANSAKDNSFSGLILAAFGALMFALSAMVNINQGIVSYCRATNNGRLSASDMKIVERYFPSGASFGLMLLLAIIVFVVAAAIVFVSANYIAKKKISISGACNLVAYSSMPIICISILNMIFGLIWFALPVIFMLLAVVLTLMILISALSKATDGENSFLVNLTVLMTVTFVTIIFLWIFLRAIDHTKVEILKGVKIECQAIRGYIQNFFYKK